MEILIQTEAAAMVILSSLMELYAKTQTCYFNSLQDEKNGEFFSLTMVQEDTLIL